MCVLVEINELIKKYLGNDIEERFGRFSLTDFESIKESAFFVLQNAPNQFGDCAALSAIWAAILEDQYNIPVVVVAGDLLINDVSVFKCYSNIPESISENYKSMWDGHCWIEINGYIGDISIFRTAYAIKNPSILKNFILNKFGKGRGMFFSPKSTLEKEMKYIPKYVLTDTQINSLINGFEYAIRHSI